MNDDKKSYGQNDKARDPSLDKGQTDKTNQAPKTQPQGGTTASKPTEQKR